MRPRRGLLVAVLAMLAMAPALLAGLSGCGGAANNASANDNFVGTWAVDSMTMGGESSGTEELELAKSLGIYLTLEEGGKANYEVFGSSVVGTWTPSEATKAKLNFSKQDAGNVSLEAESELSYADGKVTLTSGYDLLVLKKIDPSEKKSTQLEERLKESEQSAQTPGGSTMGNSASQPADPAAPTAVESGYSSLLATQPIDFPIADDAVCTIKVVAKGDCYGNPGYLVRVTNKTDHQIMVDNEGEFTVEGDVGGVIFSMSVPAGQTSEDTLWFERLSTDDGGVGSLAGVVGKIVVTNADTGEKIATYDFNA